MIRVFASYRQNEPDYDFPYIPDNAEDGEEFYWEDFVECALGNITYAQLLVERADWTFPSTMIDEDVREGVVEFNDELGTLDFADGELGETDECLYDDSFFDVDCMLY